MRRIVLFFFIAAQFLSAFSVCGDGKRETNLDSAAYQGGSEVPTAQSAVTTLTALGTTCGNCVREITNALKAVQGVTDVSVDLRQDRTSIVTVTHDPKLTEAEIRRAIIEDAGYRVGDKQ